MLSEPPAAGTSMLPAGTFADRVVLVTGGGTGIGRAIAAEFARLGADVAILSRSEDHRQAGVRAVTEAGGRGFAVAGDVRDPDQISAAFDAVQAELGPVEVLVNNAAGNFPVPAEDLSYNGWRAVVGIVLDGTFACSSELGRRAIAAGQEAVILNIGATYGWTGGPGAVHSAAAKSGVMNMTQTLAVEWAAYGIRVNCLIPGLFPHDDLPLHMRTARPGGYQAEARRIPAGRVGHVHELGWAATYMCSPFAAYLSGHSLVLDGANWLRRGLRMPEYVPVRDQLAGSGRRAQTDE
jgi:NAD(P)-dependent dehydrogenase (short-subunit alcohol dehydrogenase family)